MATDREFYKLSRQLHVVKSRRRPATGISKYNIAAMLRMFEKPGIRLIYVSQRELSSAPFPTIASVSISLSFFSKSTCLVFVSYGNIFQSIGFHLITPRRNCPADIWTLSSLGFSCLDSSLFTLLIAGNASQQAMFENINLFPHYRLLFDIIFNFRRIVHRRSIYSP